MSVKITVKSLVKRHLTYRNKVLRYTQCYYGFETETRMSKHKLTRLMLSPRKHNEIALLNFVNSYAITSGPVIHGIRKR
jgi:hypothetical protein